MLLQRVAQNPLRRAVHRGSAEEFYTRFEGAGYLVAFFFASDHARRELASFLGLRSRLLSRSFQVFCTPYSASFRREGFFRPIFSIGDGREEAAGTGVGFARLVLEDWG